MQPLNNGDLGHFPFSPSFRVEVLGVKLFSAAACPKIQKLNELVLIGKERCFD